MKWFIYFYFMYLLMNLFQFFYLLCYYQLSLLSYIFNEIFLLLFLLIIILNIFPLSTRNNKKLAINNKIKTGVDKVVKYAKIGMSTKVPAVRETPENKENWRKVQEQATHLSPIIKHSSEAKLMMFIELQNESIFFGYYY